MSDIEKNTEDFATLFNESEMNLPRTGSLVKGVVAGINDREITVDLAANLTGIISSNDISDDEEVVNNIKIGDEIEVFVIRVEDGKGLATLSLWNDFDISFLTLHCYFFCICNRHTLIRNNHNLAI